MRGTAQTARLGDTVRNSDHRTTASTGFLAPDNDGSLATTLALAVAVNLLVLAALYPSLAAVGALGLAGGFAVARYATRDER